MSTPQGTLFPATQKESGFKTNLKICFGRTLRRKSHLKTQTLRKSITTPSCSRLFVSPTPLALTLLSHGCAPSAASIATVLQAVERAQADVFVVALVGRTRIIVPRVASSLPWAPPSSTASSSVGSAAPNPVSTVDLLLVYDPAVRRQQLFEHLTLMLLLDCRRRECGNGCWESCRRQRWG